jgi:hypothetical protein
MVQGLALSCKLSEIDQKECSCAITSRFDTQELCYKNENKLSGSIETKRHGTAVLLSTSLNLQNAGGDLLHKQLQPDAARAGPLS